MVGACKEVGAYEGDKRNNCVLCEVGIHLEAGHSS